MALFGDNMTGVRRNNRRAVLELIQSSGESSRKNLAKSLSLTPAAITHITAELLSEGLLMEGATIKSGGAGRREVLLRINPKAGYALGVLLNVKAAAVSATMLDGTVVFSEEIALEMKAPSDQTVKMLADRLESLMNEYSIPRSKVVGIGLAVRGIPSRDGRSVVDSYGAIDEKNYPIAEKFESLMHLNTVMTNNVRALFSAEMFLRKAVSGSEFFLRCEYGIGASIASDGKIFRGDHEQSAEIGHITIVPNGGKLCSCGKRGCLETVASPNAIRSDVLDIFSESDTPKLYELAGPDPGDGLSIVDIMEAAARGDRKVAKIVDHAVYELANALKAVIYLLDPGRITLYGQMFEHPYCLDRFYREMKEGIDESHCPEIRKSAYNRELENRCGALLAVSRFFTNGGYFA
ncbi:MAG: ROK family transcriptional regulator [Lachnospiraceae bacterium]|nr:ROK family transcriptional regulator [Lachnospiraceae bacterium]